MERYLNLKIGNPNVDGGIIEVNPGAFEENYHKNLISRVRTKFRQAYNLSLKKLEIIHPLAAKISLRYDDKEK